MYDIGPMFILSYSNRHGCDCGNELLEGDEAAYVDGELACEDCVVEAKKVEARVFFGEDF